MFRFLLIFSLFFVSVSFGDTNVSTVVGSTGGGTGGGTDGGLTGGGGTGGGTTGGGTDGGSTGGGSVDIFSKMFDVLTSSLDNLSTSMMVLLASLLSIAVAIYVYFLYVSIVDPNRYKRMENPNSSNKDNSVSPTRDPIKKSSYQPLSKYNYGGNPTRDPIKKSSVSSPTKYNYGGNPNAYSRAKDGS